MSIPSFYGKDFDFVFALPIYENHLVFQGGFFVAKKLKKIQKSVDKYKKRCYNVYIK